MRLGAWNVKGLYRAESMGSISKYKLGLVRVQEVRWEGDGTEPAEK
jgi:hypothetical protein